MTTANTKTGNKAKQPTKKELTRQILSEEDKYLSHWSKTSETEEYTLQLIK